MASSAVSGCGILTPQVYSTKWAASNANQDPLLVHPQQYQPKDHNDDRAFDDRLEH